tara:strand:- start:81 stop:587 length:507 start_codon:yes stop_codon:yes gene_type:complete
MNKSVNLYLASCVIDDVGFWVVNFTEDDEIICANDNFLLECYRKELFGIEAAIQVKKAINSTLDILALNSKIGFYKFDNFTQGYSSEIPLITIEDIFDLWAYNYCNNDLWRKYIGLLNFRKKIKTNNKYINLGLKGNVYEFAIKLDKLTSLIPINSSLEIQTYNELMW